MSGIQSLETTVQAGVLVNLRILELSNTLTDDTDINGALLTTLLQSIASQCPDLYRLDLSKNNLGVAGASALGGLFTSGSNRSQLFITLRDTNINAEAAAAFTITTRPNEPSCDCELNLGYNPLGYDGLFAILRMLRRENCPITWLDLDNTTPVNTESQYHNIQLTDNLCPVIESGRLTILFLNENNFSGDKVLILAEYVRVCKSLEDLISNSCSLTSSEVTNILEHLKSHGCSHKNLKGWNLMDNSIDDGGVSALIDSLPELFPSLEDVNLSGNPVSGEVEEKLGKILKVSFN